MNRAVVLSAVFLVAGCEEFQEFTPKVRFDTLEVERIDFQDASVDFVFQVDNPNPIEVGLSSFSYDLGLEEVPLFAGENEDGFRLTADGESELRLPVDLVWADTWNTVQATRGEDVVDFGLKGHFGFSNPFKDDGEIRLPYNEQGDFPALRTPKFSFKKLRVSNINLTEATLELDLGVNNDHGSTLFFDAFDYNVSLGGDRLANGVINSFDVDGASEGTVTLPIGVNLLTAGSSIVNAITNGGPVDVGVGAGMDVDTPFGIVPLTINENGKINLDL